MIEWNGYLIDSKGDLYSKRGNGRKLSYHKSRKGYPMVGVMINGALKKMSVHKIVAEVFLGKCPEGLQVDHLDNCRENYHPSNLRYVTGSENVKKSYRTGGKDHSGFKAGSSKYTIEQLQSVLQLIEAGYSNKHISEAGVKIGTIKKLRNGTHFFCKTFQMEKYNG